MPGSIPLQRILAAVQGAYYAITGVWPLVHMPSFLAVTGPKTDLWLVEAVGVLVTAIGLALVAAAWRGRVPVEAAIAAFVAAIGLTAIDVSYVTREVIRPVYLADAALQAIFIIAWMVEAGRYALSK